MMNATVTLELDFELEGEFRPGRPANFNSWPGDPPEPDETEWSLRRVGLVGYDREAHKHVTRWLDLPADVIEALNKALASDSDFDEQACDAMADAAS